MLTKDGFNLSKLDAITSNFDLIISTTQKLDVAVSKVANPVARLVQARRSVS